MAEAALTPPASSAGMRRGLFGSLVWVHLLSYVALPLGFALRLVYARTLAVEDYGLLYAVAGLMLLVGGFSDLGFGQAMAHFGLRIQSRDHAGSLRTVVGYAFRVQALSGLALALLFGLLAGWLGATLFQRPDAALMVYALLGFFVASALTRSLSAAGLLEEDFVFARLAEPLRLLLMVLGSVGLLALGITDPVVFAGSWTIAAVAVLVLYWIWYRRRFAALRRVAFEPDAPLLKDMARYAWPSVLVVMVSALLTRIDIQVIAYLKGLQEVALYENAAAVATLLTAALTPATVVVFTMGSRLSGLGDQATLERHTERLLRFVVIAALPLSIAVCLSAEELLVVLFGERYADAAVALRLVGAGAFFGLLTSFSFALLTGLGLVRRRLHIVYAGAAFNVIGDYLAVTRFGYEGAAAVTLLLFVGMAAGSLRAVHSRVPFRLPIRHYAKIALLNVGFACAIAGARVALDLPPLGLLVCTLLAPLGLYAALVLMLDLVDRAAVREQLREILGSGPGQGKGR